VQVAVLAAWPVQWLTAPPEQVLVLPLPVQRLEKAPLQVFTVCAPEQVFGLTESQRLADNPLHSLELPPVQLLGAPCLQLLDSSPEQEFCVAGEQLLLAS
jgi:hypothetical protein